MPIVKLFLQMVPVGYLPPCEKYATFAEKNFNLHQKDTAHMSMMGKLELKNWVMGALGNLNHYLNEELAEYNKRAREE